MKKFTLVLLSLLTLLPLGAWAEVKSYFVAGVTYSYDTDNHVAQVNKVDPSVSSAEIPAEITVQIGGEDDKYKVTSFHSSALQNCSSLKSLTIGENITSIPSDLFKDCSALQTLTIKKTSILSNLSISFTQSALNAELCIISGGLRYYHHGAWNASGNYFSVGDGSRGYGYDAVTRDGDELAVLEKVCNIPVTTIADNAFYGTASDCSISIPKSITTISSLSFVANKLKSFSVASGNAKYKAYDDVLFDKEDYQTLISFPTQKSNTYSIPIGVVTIGAEAFNNHVNLTSVTIPSTVKTIGQSAFQYAGKNTTLSVTFNEGQLTTIERSAFQESGVTAISLPSGVTTISPSAFYNCASLQSVTLPSSLTSIGDAAFAQCKNLATLNFPSTLGSNLTIGANAFYECKLSTSITLPEKVTTIGSNAFNCSNSFRSSSFQLVNLYLPRTATFSSAITNSFVNVYRKVDIAFEDNYATYFSTMDLDVQSGLKAYTITGVDGTDLTLTQLPYIPKGKAVLLEKEGSVTLSEYYKMPSNATIESGNNITYNTDLFRGSYNPTKLDNISGDKYILSGGKFVKILQGTLPAFRCYLVVNNAEIDAPADYYTFNKDDGNSYVYKEEGVYIKKNVNIGAASLSAPDNNKITLTVTPKTGFYAYQSDITVTRNVKAVAGRAPSIDNSTIALTPAVDDADPSGVTTYTFDHVANTTYEVIVNFHKQKNFSDNNVTGGRDIEFSGSFVYDGTEKKPTVTAVKFGGNVVAPENYTISYTNNVNAGSGTITVTGKREFVNTYSKTFSIGQREISNVTVNAIANQTFTGSEIRPEVTVTDVVNEVNILSSSDYDVVYSDNIHAGTAKVTLKAKNLNYKGNKDVNFTINKKALTNSNVTFTAIPDQVVNGTNPITPAIEIKDNDNNIIIPASNYTVNYSANTEVGTANVSVTFKNDYSGTASTTFKIETQVGPRTLNVSFDEGKEWATYYWYENLTKPVGLNVYAVTGHNGTTLTLQELDLIPAGVPVLLNRTGTTMSGFTAVTTTTGSEITTDAIFKGTNSAIDLTSETGTKFILVNDKFVQTADGTLPANHCYLNFGSVKLAGINTITIKEGTGPDDFVYLVDGQDSNAGGSAVKSAISDGKITLTVTPNTEYFVEASDIKVTRSVSAVKGRAQAVDAPEAESGDVAVTAVNDSADPNGVTQYTFPADATSKYQVVINFHKRYGFDKTEYKPTITLKPGTFAYNGQEQKPEIDYVTVKGQRLAPGDYEFVRYENNVYPGGGDGNGSRMYIRGKRKFTGENNSSFSISQRDINLVKVKAIADQIYTGAALKPFVEVTDIVKINNTDEDILNNVPGKPDYEVEYLENINVGEAKVNIIANSINYTGVKTGATFKIVPKDLSVEANKPTIAAIADQYYTGSSVEPALDIKDGALQLEAGKDYTVKYSNNVVEGEGTAKADITFIGNYKGTAQATFSIVFKEEEKTLNISFADGKSWTTYYSPIDVKDVPGVKIFVVTGNKNKTGLDLITEEISFIPRNVPLLLQHTDASVTTFTGKTMPSSTKLEGVTPDLDLFRGTASDLDLSTVDGVKFILQNDKFVQAIEGTLTANHCYVHLNAEEATDLNIVDDKMAEIIIEEEGKESPRSGTVTVSSSADANGYKTITVKPTEKLYATKDEITVLRYLAAGGATSRRAPGVDNTPVEVEALSAQADPSGETKYRFKYDSNYKYQIVVNFKSRVNLSDPKVSNPVVTLKAADTQNLEYDGQEKKPAVESVKCNDKVVDPANYTISYENNVDAGKPRVIITGKRFLMGATHAEFSIEKRDFSTVTVEPIGDQEYTGSPIEPAFVIKDMVGTQNILKSTDYTVTYKNNIEVGTATISFLPKNNYGGSGKEYTFNIVPATAINMIPVDEQEGQWFSLTGQPLQNKPTQKGVYILRNKNKKTIKVRIK